MQFIKRHIRGIIASDFFHLNLLHILNDGFSASLILLLPFIALDQNLSLSQVGLLGTILSVAGIFLALPSATLAARFGGLKLLVIGAFIYGSAFLITGLTGQFLALLPLFILAGIGFGIFHPVAFALIAKWTPKQQRGRAMGNFTAIGDVGRIGIAAALSFLVVAIGWQQTAILYAVVALVAAAFFFKYLFRRGGLIEPKTEPKPTQQLSFWQVLKNKPYFFTVCAAGLDGFASSSLFVFLPFLLLQKHIDPALLGALTATFFVGNLFGKTLLGRFVDKFGSAKIFIIAELLMAIFICLLAISSTAPLIIACAVVLGAFTKGTVPVLQAMVTESAEHHGNFEKAFGIEQLVSNICIALAPIILGVVSDAFGIQIAFYIMAGSALLATLPAVGFFIAQRRIV